MPAYKRFQQFGRTIRAAVIDKDEHQIRMLLYELDESLTVKAISFIIAGDDDRNLSQACSRLPDDMPALRTAPARRMIRARGRQLPR
jgi:hypothetical protein